MKKITIRVNDELHQWIIASASKCNCSIPKFILRSCFTTWSVHDADALTGSLEVAEEVAKKVAKEKDENEKERSKGKVKEEKETERDKSARAREGLSAVPPPYTEVANYANRNAKIREALQTQPDLAAKFYDFYQSKGWVVGNAPMKDWKSAFRNWFRRRDDFVFRRTASADKETAAKENLRKMAEARKRERLEAATKPEAWALCAERCANCREGKCSEGAKWPPQLNDWPITPEQCPKFEALAASPLNENTEVQRHEKKSQKARR